MSLAQDGRAEDGLCLCNRVDLGRAGVRSLALLRRLMPAYRLRVNNEGEFVVRLLAMCIFSAFLGAMFGILPWWPWRFWIEGALLGSGLAVAATLVTSHPGSAGKLILGALLGLLLPALSSAGYPLSGVCVFGGGIGLIISTGKADLFTRVNTVLASMLAAMLGAWAAPSLGPYLYSTLPGPIASAIQWAVIGLFISIGSIPLHLTMRADPILQYVRRIRRKLKKPYREEIDELLVQYLALKQRSWFMETDDFDAFLFYKSRLEEAMLISAESSLARQALDQTVNGADEVEIRPSGMNARAEDY